MANHETTRALLLIGDIGGYTRFMKLHRLSLAHSQEITGRLLDAMAKAADQVRLVQLEGDAAFFYAPEADFGETALARVAAEQSVAMHHAFHTEQQRMVALNMCSCDACRQAGNLTVKFVAHTGEVAAQTVKRRLNVVGVDVIAVHQMLKNSVPVPEYILMTGAVFSRSEAPVRERAQTVEQELEGLGNAEIYFVDMGELASELPPPPKAGVAKRVGTTLGVMVRGMPYLVGLKKRREGSSSASS